MLRGMRWQVTLPVALVVAALVLVPLAAVIELPGEAAVQKLFGQRYVEPCGPTVHRGESGAWRDEPAAPTLRDGPSAARVGRYAYLVGGILSFDDEYEDVDSADQVERLDLVTRKWEEMPPLPRGLNHVNLASGNGDLYVLGGLTAHLVDYEATGQSWRFDSDSERWEELPPLPTPRGAGAAVTIGDRIYVVGGVADHERRTELEAYDIRTGKWERLAPMRSARDHLGGAALDGRLYVLGGRRGNDLSLTDFERYDPETDSWERLPGPPEATAGFGFEAVNGRLVAAGGENLRHRVLTGRTWAFDPQAREWDSLPDMDTPMHGHPMVEYRGRAYVFAGSECSGFHPFKRAASLEVPPA